MGATRKEKPFAIKLRKRGKSYNEISETLGVPKSTLAQWLRNVKMPSAVRKRLWSETRKKWSQSITEFNKRRAVEAKRSAAQLKDKGMPQSLLERFQKEKCF